MRELYWSGVSCKAIARLFDISHPYAWQICNFYRVRKAANETKAC